VRVGLSGTGRIGRLILRKALSQPSSQLELVAVNTTTSVETLAHLLQYDSVHGRWDAQFEIGDNELIVNGHRLKIVSQRDPALLNWRELGVELVIDATGKFKDRESLSKHLASGAKRVLLTAPGRDVDLTIVMGVNESRYDPGRHQLVSAASCTTNCAAPVLHVLDEAIGVQSGWLTSIHAFTNDQNHVDNPHKDLRRARACGSSIIPTTTGVSKALIDVLPRLAPHMKGISVRVPTQDVSLLDLHLTMKKAVQPEEIKAVFQAAIAGKMGAIIDYNELPLVSSDYIGNEKSAIVDGLSIMTQGDQLKLLVWYDNEWGYVCRVLDVARHMSDCDKEIAGGEPACLITTA